VITFSLAGAIFYAGVVGWFFANIAGHVFNMSSNVCKTPTNHTRTKLTSARQQMKPKTQRKSPVAQINTPTQRVNQCIYRHGLLQVLISLVGAPAGRYINSLVESAYLSGRRAIAAVGCQV
jgi:hypothetical protein